MIFDEDFRNQNWWDKEWIVPQFNDPRLLGDELVNECDLFFLIDVFGHREKIDILEKSPDEYNDVAVERVKKLIVKGKEDNLPVDYLYSYVEMYPKLKVLMEKRQNYIHKLAPNVDRNSV